MAGKKLPEGTQQVVAGAAASEREEELIVTEKGSRLGDKVRSQTDKLSGQAADKAKDLVSQGLERSSAALTNVSGLIGDTAASLDEKLGGEYGDYARKAAASIDDFATKLGSKDPGELIDDTRDFVKRSPGVALAGAAIVGFALARLLKSSNRDA